MNEICYLCGTEILPDETSEDHVVPKQLIKRPQPKVKGFDYAGVLPTHGICNNQFGPEVYSQKALILIKVLHDDNCFLKRQHRDNHNIQIMALNSDCFPGFTERDLEFFKFNDVRKNDYEDWSNPNFFPGKTKTNAKKNALYTALAVLSKSAAALLVSRCLQSLPSYWRVVAIPYINAANVDFDELLGNTKPFEIGVKAWVRPMENNDWFVIYKADDTLAYLLFWFSGGESVLSGLKSTFDDADPLLFEGANLKKLINYDWVQV
jgi:hypothetical protein